MREYTINDAQQDMDIVREGCGYADPTAAAAFADITTLLIRNMSANDFEKQPHIMEFVFTGLFRLRDWVFNTRYEPSQERAAKTFRGLDGGLRSRLMDCNGVRSYLDPENVDGQCLWSLFHDEFLPVVEAIRSCGDDATELDLSANKWY